MIAVVDLGELTSVQKISTSFLHDINPWIFRPVQVEFLISADGENFENVATCSSAVPMGETKKQSVVFAKEIDPVNARFVKVKAKSVGNCPEWHKGAGGKAWIFADEIIIE